MIPASSIPGISLGNVKIQSGSRDSDHAPFNGGLSSVCWDLVAYMHAKFWPL